MRLFLGIPINVSSDLIPFINQFHGLVKGKFVEPENLHITLHFFGNANPTQIIPKLQISHPKFNYTISKYGSFPSVRNPRVLWFGTDAPEFFKIYDTVKFAFNIQNSCFVPHITFCRVKSILNKRALINKLQSKINIMDVASKVVLFSSTLTPNGPIYKEVHTWNLK